MNDSLLHLFLGLGLLFGALAGLAAYLIIYNEWQHHYPTKKEPRKIAGEAAIFAFLFFLVVTMSIGYVFANYITK